MNYKRITVFLLLVASALMFTACSTSNTDTAPEKVSVTMSPTATPTTVPKPTEILVTSMPSEVPEVPEEPKVIPEEENVLTTKQQTYKIMCWGDSLTAGWCQGSKEHQFGGYRVYLSRLLETNGYSESIEFVGKWATGSCYDNDNSGTNGATIAHDYEWADSMLTDLNNGILETYNPDIIMLQIGTNDINNQTEDEANLSIATINERLENLVDGILAQMNDTDMLFLASIPYLQGNSSGYNMNVAKYNSFIKKMCEAKKSEGYHIDYVNINSVVKNDQFDDDLHPNQSGYESMGNLWYEVLTNYIDNQ